MIFAHRPPPWIKRPPLHHRIFVRSVNGVLWVVCSAIYWVRDRYSKHRL